MAKVTKGKIILGLAGETGSGKDLFCEFARKTRKDIFCFRFSDPLKDVLRIFFKDKDIKKEDLQWLGIVLKKRFGQNVLINALLDKSQQQKIDRGLIIFNGVRYWKEVEMVKELGGKIIYVTADSKTRWQRVRKRGEKKDDKFSYNHFLKLEKAKTEIQVPAIGKKADFKIENNGSKEIFLKAVKKLMAQREFHSLFDRRF